MATNYIEDSNQNLTIPAVNTRKSTSNILYINPNFYDDQIILKEGSPSKQKNLELERCKNLLTYVNNNKQNEKKKVYKSFNRPGVTDTLVKITNEIYHTNTNFFINRKKTKSLDLTLLSNQIRQEFIELHNDLTVNISNSYISDLFFFPGGPGSDEILDISTNNLSIESNWNNKEYKSLQIYDETFISNPIINENIKRVRKLSGSDEELFTSSLSENGNMDYSSFVSNKAKKEYELKYIDPGENLRHSYLNKLKHANIWTNDKPKSHNSLIIFDWDDTLLCSSYLTPYGVFRDDTPISDNDMKKLALLDESVYKILNFAIENASTYIITNAAPGWVEYSSERFYPKTKEILKKVTIVSARGEYEKKFPGDSKQWKVQAFLETCRNLNLNLVTNLICLGDSVIEMEAAHILASKFSKAFIKTVKFKECPKPEELIKQLTTVLDQFNTILSNVKNLTIRVEKKKKKDKEKNK